MEGLGGWGERVGLGWVGFVREEREERGEREEIDDR